MDFIHWLQRLICWLSGHVPAGGPDDSYCAACGKDLSR